jgi:hypothetical protein
MKNYGNIDAFFRYPRTRHIEGSAFQDGDYDLDAVPFEQIKGRHIVIEEKVDGSQVGISFSNELNSLLQSRGHYLTGGPREKQFELLKQWFSVHSDALLNVLEDKYVMYGEWLYAKHTVFYDNLPHYFMEFDIFDKEAKQFLDTHRRFELLKKLPIVPVLVLWEGEVNKIEDITIWLGLSFFKTDRCNDVLVEYCKTHGLDAEKVMKETSSSRLMEGLYIKVEEDGIVKERYKYVRGDFLQAIKDSDSHWLSRPIVPNILDPNARLYQLDAKFIN